MRALLLCAALLAAPSSAFAQTEEDAGDVSEVDRDRTGPLRERVRPVSGHLFRKKGRLELSPSLTASFNDPFFQKVLGGATLSYYLSENLGVNLRFGLDLPALVTDQALISRAAQICPTGTTESGARPSCAPPRYDNLDGRVPGQITVIGGADVQYAPIYGKVGLVAETFLHFDLYGLVGASYVGYRGPNPDGPGAAALSTVGGNVGLGARFVLSRWAALRAELRDLVYVERVNTVAQTSLRNQLLFELGFSVFLPSTFTPE